MLEGQHTYGSVNDQLSQRCPGAAVQKGWIVGFLVGFALLNMLMVAIVYLLVHGCRDLGHQRPR